MNTTEYFNLFDEGFSQEEKKRLIEFFISFSRFEYALKASGFVNLQGNRIYANWDLFIASIIDNFIQTKNDNLNSAVNYIIDNPPRIQSLVGGAVMWRDRQLQENEPLINKLRLHISDIRNNLFHGGKFNGSYQAEIARNNELIKSALIILNEWLILHEEVNNNFSLPSI